jgi:rubrerythrin
MGPALTVADVLKKAIQREIDAQRLYSDLGARVPDPTARFVFSSLTQQEQHHQEILERYLGSGLGTGALDLRQVIDYRIAEHLDAPILTPDIKLSDIFLVAANREKASHEFYTALAELHPEGEIRLLLLKLASEEMGHKHTIESLFTEVAFPQTDGG